MSRLLLVFLRGAADGLNMAIPPDSQYDAARPTLAVPDSERIDLGDGWALNAAMPSLAARFGAGEVALVPAVRMSRADRSHFAAQALFESGGAGQGGWVGRCLAATEGEKVQPFRGVSVGSSSVPAAFMGSTDVVGATTLDNLRLAGAAVDPEWFGGLWQSTTSSPAAGGALAAVEVQATVDEFRAAQSADERGFDNTEAGKAFGEADRVWQEEVGAEVVMVNLFRWDTHSQQDAKGGGTFSRLIADLDRGLEVLLARHDDDDDPITTLIATEFGRRVAENDSNGTDHGSGSLAIVAGRRVVGGFHGEWPGLAQLDDGDVRPVNAMESILAEVAEKVMGVDPELAVPEASTVKQFGLIR